MIERVAVVGLGRLGATLVELLRRAGRSCRGFDPGRSHPDGAGSLAEAVADAELIVVAVPLSALGAALEALRPLLTDGQLVIDVCGVRRAADAILVEVLGADGPFVGTHPLFGPSCLEEGAPERRVVVCPRPGQSGARVVAFYAQIGCRTVEMSADEHDRLMAGSQSLAAFLGAGLRRLGLDQPNPWTPPSTAALTQLARLQNAGDGHLRDLMLFTNPYAAEERDRLLSTLHELARPPAVEDADPSRALSALRAEIDEVDRSLIDLFARRAEIACVISRHKAALGRPVHDPVREAAAFADRRRWAEARSVDADFVEQIFEAILHWSRGLQEAARIREAQT